MKLRRRVLSVLLTAVLLFGLSTPVSAASLYFTAINDSIPPLTADTMPFWSGGQLYVPYTVFDSNQNGVNVSLGLYAKYSQSAGTVTLFNLRQVLVFDLTSRICRDDMTGTTYSSWAVMRSGKPYLPLNMVCSFFGLEYSYNHLPSISQGYLVRIKSADAVLDDALFIERARDLINNRLREYTQSLSAAESTDPIAAARPSTPPEVDGSDTATYLAFRCENGDGLSAILDALDQNRQYAVFFLTPQMIEAEGDLVRRMLGTGHSVGVWAGDGEEGQLERGNLALEAAAHTRTTLAYAPEGQRDSLEQAGWVCWAETLLLEPGDSVGGTSFAGSVLNRLGNRRTVYLTLEGSGNTARVLPTLLRQLRTNNYMVAIPIETRI